MTRSHPFRLKPSTYFFKTFYWIQSQEQRNLSHKDIKTQSAVRLENCHSVPLPPHHIHNFCKLVPRLSKPPRGRLPAPLSTGAMPSLRGMGGLAKESSP